MIVGRDFNHDSVSVLIEKGEDLIIVFGVEKILGLLIELSSRVDVISNDVPSA